MVYLGARRVWYPERPEHVCGQGLRRRGSNKVGMAIGGLLLNSDPYMLGLPHASFPVRFSMIPAPYVLPSYLKWNGIH